MTVKEIYEQTIKPLAADDRAALANLILDDLAPEPPNAFHSEDELEQMLLAGLNSGPGITVTPEYWQKKKERLVERLGRRTAAQ